jgi:hypothetical protein
MLDMERELAAFGRGSEARQQYALLNVRRWTYDALDQDAAARDEDSV